MERLLEGRDGAGPGGAAATMDTTRPSCLANLYFVPGDGEIRGVYARRPRRESLSYFSRVCPLRRLATSYFSSIGRPGTFSEVREPGLTRRCTRRQRTGS